MMPAISKRTAVRRSGRTISAETAASLRQIMAKHDEAIATLTDSKAACQALIDGSNQQEMEEKLARQWAAHELH
jgi:hypothetical protein